MTAWEKAFYLLLVVSIVRELIYQYTTQVMLNKLMSRNFFEYQQGLQVTSRGTPEKKEIKEDLPEDLGTLQGIGV